VLEKAPAAKLSSIVPAAAAVVSDPPAAPIEPLTGLLPAGQSAAGLGDGLGVGEGVGFGVGVAVGFAVGDGFELGAGVAVGLEEPMVRTGAIGVP
jgi:hypothetical protein